MAHHLLIYEFLQAGCVHEKGHEEVFESFEIFFEFKKHFKTSKASKNSKPIFMVPPYRRHISPLKTSLFEPLTLF